MDLKDELYNIISNNTSIPNFDEHKEYYICNAIRNLTRVIAIHALASMEQKDGK